MKIYTRVFRMLCLSILLTGAAVAFAEEPAAAKFDYKVVDKYQAEDGRLIINYTRTPATPEESASMEGTPVGPNEIVVTAVCTKLRSDPQVSRID